MKESNSWSSWSLLGAGVFLAPAPLLIPRPRPLAAPRPPALGPRVPRPPRMFLPLAVAPPRPPAPRPPPRPPTRPPPPRLVIRPVTGLWRTTLLDRGRAACITEVASEAISIFMGRPSRGTPSYCFRAEILTINLRLKSQNEKTI